MLPLVYDELRLVAREQLLRERRGKTLTPTSLVHEAYLRLIRGQSKPRWEDRRHFFLAASRAMRQILVDQARRKYAIKRGGAAGHRIEVDDLEISIVDERLEILELHDVLNRFAQHDAEAARFVQLRYFSGLSIAEAAEVLGISERSGNRMWIYARAWLYQNLRAKHG